MADDPECREAAKVIEVLRDWRRLRSLSYTNHFGVEDAVSMTRQAACAEELDRIYAVLSLAPTQIGSLILQPNYKLSLRTAQENMARASILQYQSLNILRYVEHDAEIEMPSWVPRWQRSATEPLQAGYTFRALHPTRIIVDGDTGSLRIDGIPIMEVGPCTDRDPAYQGSLLLLHATVSAIKIPSRYHDAFHDYLDNKAKASTSLVKTKISKKHFAHEVRKDIKGEFVDLAHTDWKDMIPWPEGHSRLRRIDFEGRRLAVTNGGILAMVPALTELRDLVVLFKGIRLPFVVRPINEVGSSATSYDLIGACKLQALIRWDILEGKNTELHEIRLR